MTDFVVILKFEAVVSVGYGSYDCCHGDPVVVIVRFMIPKQIIYLEHLSCFGTPESFLLGNVSLDWDWHYRQ